MWHIFFVVFFNLLHIEFLLIESFEELISLSLSLFSFIIVIFVEDLSTSLFVLFEEDELTVVSEIFS